MYSPMYSQVATASTRDRRRTSRPPSWCGIAVAALLVGLVPVTLWMIANPVGGVVVGGGVVGVAVVATSAVRRLRPVSAPLPG